MPVTTLLCDTDALFDPDPPDDACCLKEPRMVPGALAVPEGTVKRLEETGVLP